MRVTCYNEHLSVAGWQLAKVLEFGWAGWRSRRPTLGGRMRADVETVCIFGGLFAHRSMGRRAGGLAHSREESGNFSGTQVECMNADKAVIAENGGRKTEDRRRNTEYGIPNTEYGRAPALALTLL